MTLADALKFLVVHIGQRHKIAHHQAHAPVVVLDVKRFAASGRHLVDKAENAVVLADAGFEQSVAEIDAQLLIFVLFAGDLHLFPVVKIGDRQIDRRNQRLIVD